MKIREFRGARDLVAAIVTEDSLETYKTDKYFPIAGLQKVTKTTETDSATHYYDNVPAIVIDGVGSDTVTFVISVPDLETYAKLLGMNIDAATGALIEGEAEVPYVAIGYVTGLVGAKGERYVSRLKGKCSIPDEENSTSDNSTDATNMSLVYTGINTTHKFVSTGKTAKAVVIDNLEGEESKVDFDRFFEEVTSPDNIPTKTTTVAKASSK